MDLKWRFLATLLLCIGTHLAYGEVLNSDTFPPDLNYGGQPLDPLCFYNLHRSSQVINLANCGLEKENYQYLGQNTILTRKGYYGFDWDDGKNKQYLSAVHGYSYYKAWPAGQHEFWLFTVNGGGGSGEFTAVNLTTRKTDDMIKVNTIASGDRCNGGITSVKEMGKGIEYGVNITAADFLKLSHHNPHHLRPYRDLAACAACCVATAYYQVDSRLKPKLLYVDLSYAIKSDGVSDQGRYQLCFNNLVMHLAAKGEYILQEPRLKEFTRFFDTACVH